MNDRQSGQLMIIVALGLMVFLAFAALVVDLGHAYSQRRSAQNAADAAAMAGIRMVRMRTASTTATTINNEILRVAGLNGSAQVSSALFLDVSKNSLGPVASYAGSLDDVAGLRVNAQIQYNTYFAGLLGFSTLTSTGTAASMSLAVNSVTGSGLWPIARLQESLSVGTEYTIWDDDKEAAGNAGWVDFNGGSNSAAELKSWLANGFQSSGSNEFYYWEGGGSPGSSHQDDTLPFPSWLSGDTGNKNSVSSEIEALVGDSVTVMIFDTVIGTGSNTKYQVVGLAQFTITEVDMSGGNKSITGTYERMVLPGDPSATPSTSSMSTIRLVAD